MGSSYGSAKLLCPVTSYARCSLSFGSSRRFLLAGIPFAVVYHVTALALKAYWSGVVAQIER